jgi:hypothetical protein
MTFSTPVGMRIASTSASIFAYRTRSTFSCSSAPDRSVHLIAALGWSVSLIGAWVLDVTEVQKSSSYSMTVMFWS